MLKRIAITIAASTAVSLLTGGIWITKHALRGEFLNWSDVLVPEALFWNGWGAMTPLVFWLCARLPLRREGAGHLLWHVPAALALPLGGYSLALLTGALINMLSASEVDAVARMRGQFEGHYVYGIGFIMGCLMYGVTASAAYARSYYSSFRREELRRSQLEAQLAQAQLQALKMQLHPHFFFNTLNSISSLLHSDVDAADAMLAKLGDFLRLTLDQNHLEYASVEDELGFVRCYMEIEQIRFGDRLQVGLEAQPDALKARVPNFVLQPLVENAVGHGIARSIRPGRIEVRARVEDGQLVLEVEDNGPGLGDGESGEQLFGRGIGLVNTRARLREHYGENFSIDLLRGGLGGFLARLQLPYTEHEVG